MPIENMRGSANSKQEHEQDGDDGDEGDDDDHDHDDDDDDNDDEYEEVYVNVVFPPTATAFETESDPIKNANSSSTNASALLSSNSSNGQQRSSINPSTDLQESIDYKTESGVSTNVNKLRISGISKEKPLFQKKNNIMQGEWSRLVGTELVFDENGEYLTTVNQHIVLKDGRMVPKKYDNRSLFERAAALALQKKKEDDEVEQKTVV